MIASMPVTTSSTLAFPAGPVAGRLLVPAWSTINFGETPSSSPFWRRPENVLGRIAAPSKVGRISAVEVPFPVREEFGMVGRSPSPRDRVAFEVHIDSAMLRFGQKLLVSRDRVGISSLDCLVRRLCGDTACLCFSIRFCEMFVGPLDEVLDVGFVGVAAVVLSPGELSVEHIHVHGGHLFGLIIVAAPQVASTEQSEHRLGRDRGQ